MDSHLIPFLSLENLHLREETFVKKILLPKAGPWTLDLDTGGVVAMAGRRQGDPREFTLSRRSSGKTHTHKMCPTSPDRRNSLLFQRLQFGSVLTANVAYRSLSV